VNQDVTRVKKKTNLHNGGTPLNLGEGVLRKGGPMAKEPNTTFSELDCTEKTPAARTLCVGGGEIWRKTNWRSNYCEEMESFRRGL